MSEAEEALKDAVDAVAATAAAYVASLPGHTVHSYELADYRVRFAGSELLCVERK